MKEATKIFLAISVICYALNAVGQEHTLPIDRVKIDDTSHSQHYGVEYKNSEQIDIVDIGLMIGKIFSKKAPQRSADTILKDVGKPHVSLLPGVGYSLQTGFVATVTGNCGYYTTSQPDANLNSIESSINYSQLNQLFIPVQASLWSKNNTYNLQTDWRYLKVPQLTYGLGGYSSLHNGYSFNYSNVRIYTTLYKAVATDVYAGFGYDFDYVWNVREIDPPAGLITDFQKYGIVKTDLASGPTLNFLYDTRRNSINPLGGNFVNVVYRPSPTFLGSYENWQSLIVDLRKYIRLSPGSKNVLAFWNYEWLTFGHPSYALLPNNGADPNGNTGRGFIEGRFRGKNMLYLEGEYRFGILNNGFLGGVIFANGQSYSEESNDQFARVYLGYGAGIRIKFNKFSKTNVAIDYGFGSDGSKGVFINLGEVF